MTIKQVIYSRATESQNQSEEESESLIIFTLSQSKGAKQKEHKKEVSRILQKYV